MSPERDFNQALCFSELVLAHEFTEYRCIDPARKRPTLSFWGVLNTEEDFADLARENGKGYGVFDVINRLPPEMEAHIVAEDQRAARDKDVTGVHTFFVEIDREEVSPGDNLRALQNAPLRPSLIVQSSLPHKLHA